ncbi:MAG: hypothetical protein JW810_06895 [Sedimentisphaerales bacterium]|nr:hypothetical protein [Sedimentisphaerales bacterium]
MSRSCGINRREFIAAAGAAGFALGALGSLSAASAADNEFKPIPPKPLKVQPVLAVTLFQRREQTSWRSWGAIHTQQDITQEQQRIQQELDRMAKKAEFALEIMPLVTLNDPEQAAKIAQGPQDVTIMYAANSWLNVLEQLTNPDKWTIMFVRHKSGPVYLWYEIAHNRYLRKTVDQYGQPSMDCQDVVVDEYDDVLWRLRALFGLKNTLGKRMVAIGGPSGWGSGGQKAPDISRTVWKMDIQTVDYPTLGEMIKKARQNNGLVKRCHQQAEDYLKGRGVKLETNKEFVQNAFVLTEVFQNLMAQAQTDALTVNNCMGTIMPISETTACLPLCLLNDTGYNLYCESDFVVIPSGVLLHHISSQPVFLNDPTYPHHGVVTMAHCTAPRRMDGKNLEPVRVLTHFESDYGAAPKVEMKRGQRITVIDPDFDNQRWLGFEGEIIDNPFLDICRSQIDVQINGDCDTLVQETRGFHWMACYGDYLKEVSYALKKVGVDWMNLTKKA